MPGAFKTAIIGIKNIILKSGQAEKLLCCTLSVNNSKRFLGSKLNCKVTTVFSSLFPQVVCAACRGEGDVSAAKPAGLARVQAAGGQPAAGRAGPPAAPAPRKIPQRRRSQRRRSQRRRSQCRRSQRRGSQRRRSQRRRSQRRR